MGSPTTQDWPKARAIAHGHAAFRFDDSVGILIAIFRSSIPSPSVPLFTLQCTPRDVHCKTRGRVVRYSLLVRLLHPLLHAGLSRLCAFDRSVWNDSQADERTKKRLLRALIREIVVDIDEQTSAVVLLIHWKGGVLGREDWVRFCEESYESSENFSPWQDDMAR